MSSNTKAHHNLCVCLYVLVVPTNLLTSLNYMQALITHIIFFSNITNINFFFYFIEFVEISDKFAYYNFQLIAILGAYIILCDLLW